MLVHLHWDGVTVTWKELKDMLIHRVPQSQLSTIGQGPGTVDAIISFPVPLYIKKETVLIEGQAPAIQYLVPSALSALIQGFSQSIQFTPALYIFSRKHAHVQEHEVSSSSQLTVPILLLLLQAPVSYRPNPCVQVLWYWPHIPHSVKKSPRVYFKMEGLYWAGLCSRHSVALQHGSVSFFPQAYASAMQTTLPIKGGHVLRAFTTYIYVSPSKPPDHLCNVSSVHYYDFTDLVQEELQLEPVKPLPLVDAPMDNDSAFTISLHESVEDEVEDNSDDASD